MSQTHATVPAGDELERHLAALHTDGIAALRGAFDREWVARLGREIEALFAEAVTRPGGAIGRGPNRWYVEIHPEDISGFADLAGHPWVKAVCASVLGPDYRIVEVGFDIPFPGAENQPWHRDFLAPPETYRDRRLTSLAFNLTTVDVSEDMGPFEIAPGTHWEPGQDWADGMFPPESRWPHYAAIAARKTPRMGDVSVRSALTVHRGTANRSQQARPTLVLGVDAPGAGHDAWHDLMVTRGYLAALPADVRDHLACRVVEELEPVVQQHTIAGLVEGVP